MDSSINLNKVNRKNLLYRKNRMKYQLLFLLFYSSLFAQNIEWGWEAHRYINDLAVDYLPAEMSFFQDHRNYLQEHSSDPDRDELPGYYHYIDIDYYPEFFSGTLPHNLDNLIALYGLSIVQNNGIVPWIIEQWTDSLSALMKTGQWDEVWQVAAELGHYVADSNQPLHLARNYNGQLTGNYGIHSRYETHMINPHLSQLPLPTGSGIFWTNVIDSVFSYIGEIYPYVDSIMIADDLASAQDPGYENLYYSILWEELEDLTTISIHKAIIDLASLWRTAWENAGRPSPLGIRSTNSDPEVYYLAEAYPNPFNSSTNIKFSIPQSEFVSLKIYNMIGQELAVLVSRELTPGTYKYTWSSTGGIASGVYLYRLQAGDHIETGKMVLMK
jgi:hypothetical protein